MVETGRVTLPQETPDRGHHRCSGHSRRDRGGSGLWRETGGGSPAYPALGYTLADEYLPFDFFDRFDYYSDVDPTEGFVDYVDGPTARALNLTTATASSAVLRVDASMANATQGRRSVRLESTTAYDRGLFVFDILHTPYGCGTWPALWLTDPGHWPDNGEIDVLETTNRGSEGNAVTLHTGGKCMMDGERRQEGTPGEYANCDNSAHSNAGCGVEGESGTYGEEMNAGGGGVYALELRPAGIRVWYFPRDSIPDDIDTDTSSASNGSIVPDPSSWPTPLADFPGTNCDIAAQFRNQSIIANIDLCGELGAQPRLYKELYSCPATCEEFVAHNPGNFTEAYWEFRSFRVYQVD
ncbi:hypothetical protein PHISP_02525 [Aspergillus sp. HF37]|nr:hypothetical protein PHISP_02525 [Aspergillus sp. HF37]